VATNERIADGWLAAITATRTLDWSQKRVAGALYRAVRDELDGGDPATTSGVARSEEMSRYAAHRAIDALRAAGWVDRRQTVFYLQLRPGLEPVAAPYHDCPQCDGTGWRSVPAPPTEPHTVPELTPARLELKRAIADHYAAWGFAPIRAQPALGRTLAEQWDVVLSQAERSGATPEQFDSSRPRGGEHVAPRGDFTPPGGVPVARSTELPATTTADVVKCERCGGSGRLPGPEAAPDA
jgi:hypothetical protein